MRRYSISISLLLIIPQLAFAGIPILYPNWLIDGAPVTTETGTQWFPRLVADGEGGAIIAWMDKRSKDYYDIYAQRIDTDGYILWTTDGIPVCTAGGDQREHWIATDGSGGAIVTWADYRSGSDSDIYAQRIDPNGNTMWTGDGVAVCSAEGDQTSPQIVEDGSGATVITWVDARSGAGEEDIYAMKIDPDGNALWTWQGVAVTAASHDQYAPQITSDGAGGAIIAWEDKRAGGNPDIYAQRIDSGGNALWTADGVMVSLSDSADCNLRMAYDEDGGAILTWDNNGGGSFDIFAQRLDASGNPLWAPGGLGVCTAPSPQIKPEIVSDMASGAIIAWTDLRNVLGSDIYAQRVDAGGGIMWSADGVLVCGAESNQSYHKIATDGLGGAVITWRDERVDNNNADIYAQRVDHDGGIQWTEGGVRICAADGLQTKPQLVYEGYCGVIIAWADFRNLYDSDIYAMKVCEGLPPVATLLQSSSCSIDGADVVIEWTLTETGPDVDFHVYRAPAYSATFVEIFDPQIIRSNLNFSFRDRGTEPGRSYRYAVEMEDESGRSTLFMTDDVTVPAAFLSLEQNHPNPFNPVTTIGYYVPRECRIELGVYDVSGTLVKRVTSGSVPAGHHKATWSGIDESGRPAASGVYFYRLRAGKEVITRKMTLLR